MKSKSNINDSHRFSELPRRQQFIPLMTSSMSTRKGTISKFFSTTNCATCEKQCHNKVCQECRNNSQKTVLDLTDKICKLERKVADLQSICQNCCRRGFEIECVSLDCPVLYATFKAKLDARQIDHYQGILDEF